MLAIATCTEEELHVSLSLSELFDPPHYATACNVLNASVLLLQQYVVTPCMNCSDKGETRRRRCV